MSNVTLAVGGRNYTVSCEDGQEDHVQRLARVIDEKLGSMGANLSGQEAKNLFAALLLADELDEAKKAAVDPAEPAIDADKLAGQLERIAIALENAASTLESGAGAS
jgi:cell division protein ZapA